MSAMRYEVARREQHVTGTYDWQRVDTGGPSTVKKSEPMRGNETCNSAATGEGLDTYVLVLWMQTQDASLQAPAMQVLATGAVLLASSTYLRTVLAN